MAPLQWRELGNASAAKTMIFLHGWPDDDMVFEKQYAAFKDEFRLVAVTLPGYERQKTKDFPFFGYSHQQVRDMYHETIVEAMKDQGPGKKPILVCHDWGAPVTMYVLAKYPDIAEKAVIMDVGGHMGKLPLKAALFGMWYQGTNILVYMLPGFIADPLCKWFSETLLAAPDYGQVKRGRMNFMYLRYWQMQFIQGIPKDMRWPRPTVPTLFLYGTNKPMMFHSDKWVENVEANGGKVVPVKAGHWFLRKKADEVNAAMKEFVGAKL